MEKELRILILEDVPADAELMERELRKGGIIFSSKKVDTKKAFLKELKEFAPDLILGDYSLPSFDGLTALEIVREKCPAGTPVQLPEDIYVADFLQAIHALSRPKRN